jgi:hypothetical protein
MLEPGVVRLEVGGQSRGDLLQQAAVAVGIVGRGVFALLLRAFMAGSSETMTSDSPRAMLARIARPWLLAMTKLSGAVTCSPFHQGVADALYTQSHRAKALQRAGRGLGFR